MQRKRNATRDPAQQAPRSGASTVCFAAVSTGRGGRSIDKSPFPRQAVASAAHHDREGREDMTATTAACSGRRREPGEREALARILPAGRAGDDRRSGADHARGDCSATACGAYAERPAVESFGKRMSYAELGTAADAVASWLQAQGLQARRPGRDHAAERDGLSGDPVRRPHGRLHGRQRQPALHAARARPSAAAMPALASSSCSRISATRSRRRCRRCASTRSWSSRRAISWVSRARSSTSSRGT